MDWDFLSLGMGWDVWIMILIILIPSLLAIVYKIGIEPWMERKVAEAESETMPRVGDGEDEKGSTPRSGT